MGFGGCGFLVVGFCLLGGWVLGGLVWFLVGGIGFYVGVFWFLGWF